MIRSFEEGVQFRRCHDCAIENSVVSYPNPIAPGQAAAIFIHLGSNNGVIYWRVLTTTSDCDGAWSQTASFRTAP